ncbi:MAG: Hsp20 family protein [Alphaproteobacteria bacterium]|nr:Hsp20 family protein [Alphaproteobacteria bacterium]
MTRLSLFDSPLFLGFDHFEETFDRMRKSAAEGYPPYNIEQTHENGLRISLAVAGFSMQDLDIEVENNQLTIRGKQIETEEDLERIYIHRGIAARQFQRSFVLADGIEVLGASLDNGLLHIDMERKIPESNARKIEISGQSSAKKLANGASSTAQAIDVDTNDKKKK